MDSIEFQKVVPHPLRDSQWDGEVWNTQLVLNKGTHYLIKAASGKGKSTMLNIIFGIRTDYDGVVLLENKELKQQFGDLSELRKNHISYLFQDLRLFPQLTAMENIRLKPECRLDDTQIQNYAARLGVENQLHKTCNTLSLGQQQRIAIIRSLAQPFEWLLLDEPFSHLDKKNAETALELILEKSLHYGAGIIATSLGEDILFSNFNTLVI